METMRQDNDILSHQLCGQQEGGTSTHVAPCCEKSRLVKIKNIKKQNLLYGCFKNNPQRESVCL